MTPPLVLASTSPRRIALLAAAGIACEAVAIAVDEDALTAELLAAGAAPATIARALARAKAAAGAALRPDARVLAADTLVVLDGTLLGKPRDAAEALATLSRLSGRSHEVITGVAVREPDGSTRTGAETTLVTFARWPAADRRAYVATGEPLDKAGAYGIQGPPGPFVDRIDGCFFNVVGLPLARVRRMLASSAMAEGPTP